jgi:glutamate synthase (NADPH) large chain
LQSWDSALSRFTEVMPRDFRRVLDTKAAAEREGLTEAETTARMMEASSG